MSGCLQDAAEKYSGCFAGEAKELLKVLARIPSPSHDEGRRAVFIRDWFIKNGFTNVRIDAMKNVVCELGPMDDELTVFAAHTDIVFPDTEELPLREEDGVLYAPGVGDDTCNLVQLMVCARYLREHESELQHGVLIVADACEEGLGNLDGIKFLFSRYERRIRFFYSFDGHMGSVTNGAVGSYRYRVTCKTEGGHSYADFGNLNAIREMCLLIDDLYDVSLPSGSKTTFNVGRIEGGTTVNSIAQECSILYEFRSESQNCLEVMKQHFNDSVAGHCCNGVEFDVELLGIRPGAGNVDREALERMTDSSLKIISMFFDKKPFTRSASTDSNVPLSLGICANTVGAYIGRKAHTRAENIDLDSMDTGMKILFGIMVTATGIF